MIRHDEGSPEDRKVDRDLFQSIAGDLADRFSRRSALYGLGSSLAALFGIRFIPPLVADTFLGMPAAQASALGAPQSDATDDSEFDDEDESSLQAAAAADRPVCIHGHAPGCVAASLKCGFNNTRDCAAFNNPALCPGCWDAAAGCPKPLVRATNFWSACCLCVSKNGKPTRRRGEVVKYLDCCGSAISTTPPDDCSPCDANAVAGGCHGDTTCNGNAPQTSGLPWCGTTPGSPLCTLVLPPENTLCRPPS